MGEQSQKVFGFTDADSGQEVLAIIRQVGVTVGLCLSQKSGSDTEVWMSTADCSKVLSALREALRQARANEDQGTQ